MNTKILQLSTDSRYLRSVTLMRLINNARLTIFHHRFRCSIHTGPKITSSEKLSSLNNSLMGVPKKKKRRNDGMAEKLSQILEDGLAGNSAPNLRRRNDGKLSQIPQMKQWKISFSVFFLHPTRPPPS